jgi:hypothetical protein
MAAASDALSMVSSFAGSTENRRSSNARGRHLANS